MILILTKLNMKWKVLEKSRKPGVSLPERLDSVPGGIAITSGELNMAKYERFVYEDCETFYGDNTPSEEKWCSANFQRAYQVALDIAFGKNTYDVVQAYPGQYGTDDWTFQGPIPDDTYELEQERQHLEDLLCNFQIYTRLLSLSTLKKIALKAGFHTLSPVKSEPKLTE